MTVAPITQLPAKPAPLGNTRPVIDALRSVQSESDRWVLAEKLLALIPSGEAGFQEIVDRAASEGIEGKFTAKTLSLYRNTAIKWPIDKRVDGVSFSAHREAQAVTGGISASIKLLNAQVKIAGSPSKVSVSEVRKAVRSANGKAPAPSARSGGKSAAAQKVGDAVQDLKVGGKQLIATIDTATPASDLDAIHAGLNKVITHVERLRTKWAAKSKAAAAAPKNGAKPKVAPRKAAGGAGDLRGL